MSLMCMAAVTSPNTLYNAWMLLYDDDDDDEYKIMNNQLTSVCITLYHIQTDLILVFSTHEKIIPRKKYSQEVVSLKRWLDLKTLSLCQIQYHGSS